MAFDKHKAMSTAQTYAQQGKWDKAIAEYLGILKVDPRSIAIYNTLGDIYLRLGNKNEAVAQYAKLGEAYSKDGLYAKAVALYKKIQNITPQDYKVYMVLGDLYSQQGLMGEAKSQYLAAANYLSKTNQLREALEVYQKMADLEPANFTVRVKIGEMYLKEKMLPQAVEQFMRVAEGYLASGNKEEARPFLSRVLQYDPQNLEGRKLLGQILLERGDTIKAAQILEPAVEAAPDDINLLASLGELYQRNQLNEKARTCLEKVISLDPAHLGAHRSLGKLFLNERELKGAFEHLDTAAKALAQKEQFAEAQALYREILSQDPRHTPARENLAALLERGGEAEKAIPEYKIVAGLYRELGRNGEAAELYRKILKIKPDDVVALKGLEVLQEATSRGVKAEKPAEPLEEATTIGLVDEVEGLGEELGLPSMEEIPLTVEEEKTAPPEKAASLPSPEVEEDITFKLETTVEPATLESKESIAIEGAEPAPPRGTLEGPLEEEVSLEEEVTEFEEEDPVVAEHMIEADVYLKYGLTDRAVELLRSVIEKNPRSIACRAKLKKIYQEKGQKDLVVKESLSLAEIFAQKGERQLAEEELKSVLSLEPENSLARLRLKGLKESPPAPRGAGAIKKPAPEAKAPAGEEEDMVETLEGVPLELLEPEEIPQELLEKSKAGAKSAGAASSALEIIGEPKATEEEAAISVDEDLALARFYRQQGLKDEAREILQNILSQYPQHTGALQELTALEQGEAAPSEEAVEWVSAEPVADAPTAVIELPSPPPATGPDLKEKFSGAGVKPLKELPPAEETFEVPIPEIPLPSFISSPPMGKTRDLSESTPIFTVNPPVDEKDAGAFVDIGAELEEELEDKPQALPDTKAKSLSMEEIFQEFKKGVQQQLSPEDYETHYNLGIAYKEMGLLDEAISEFQLSAKGSRRFLDSISMMGMCFMEKGMTELAINQYQRALASPDLREEETLSVRFDLGLAYEKMGVLQKSLDCYMQVYGMDAKFRNVAAKINTVKSKLAQGGPPGEETGGKTPQAPPPPPPKTETPPPEVPPAPPKGGKKNVSYI